MSILPFFFKMADTIFSMGVVDQLKEKNTKLIMIMIMILIIINNLFIDIFRANQ